MDEKKLQDSTHLFCSCCASIQPGRYAGEEFRDTTGRFIGGDLVCQKCAYVVATLYRPLTLAELIGDEAQRLKESRERQ